MWLANNNTQTRYSNAVNLAISDENYFQGFKSNDDYNCIVGMSEQWQGPLFYEHIKNNFKNIFDNFNKLKLNDTIGSPSLLTIDGIIISPNTLRYIKTLCDLTEHFGSLNDFVITELGVGYGGLAYIISSQYDIKDYVLCDLPKVQELAIKYLNRLDINKITLDKNKYDKIDLFISEFCLSEFDDNGIYQFYYDLISKSDKIYLTMNLHDEDRKTRFLEIVSKDFDIKILPEFPETRWPNYIIIGNKRND